LQDIIRDKHVIYDSEINSNRILTDATVWLFVFLMVKLKVQGFMF
jgi:hypothetical protein